MTIPNVSFGLFDLAAAIPYLAMALIMGGTLLMVPAMTWIERVFLALIQDREGPNRVGPRGLLQPIADGIKLFFKEDLKHAGVDQALYFLAPIIVLIPALAAGATLPLATIQMDMGHGVIRSIPFVVGNANIGLLFVFALTSLQVYGIVLAGWASNSKYSLLGGLRSSAQAISYELSMGLSALTAILFCGSLNLVDVVRAQAGTILDWNILRMPPLGLIAGGIYVVALIAETNRAPFDLPEAESELVAGFHTEYSSMKFAMFAMGEYASLIVASSVAVVLWFGGWQPIHPALSMIPGGVWFVGKLACMLVMSMWIRATLPRLRYDALMALGWKRMLPMAVVVLLAAACVDAYRTPETRPAVRQAAVEVRK